MCCRRLLLFKHKEAKTYNKTTKKTKQREGAYLQALALPSHFWLMLLPFRFKLFSRSIFFFSSEREKNYTVKKKCKEGKELTFKLLFCPLTFGFCFWPLIFGLSFQALSPWHFFFKWKKKEKHKEKKNHREEKNAKNGRSLPFFSRFYIWDEALLLLFPFHIPSTLSSPPSSSLVSHVSLKLCVIQDRELS